MSYLELSSVQLARITAFHAPCHTKGHVLYYFESLEHVQEKLYGSDNLKTCIVNRALFTGDTIFIGGSGSFFEGIPKEMAENIEWIKQLPHNTQIFCGHDYVEINMEFSMGFDKDNPAYEQQLIKMQAIKSLGINISYRRLHAALVCRARVQIQYLL